MSRERNTLVSGCDFLESPRWRDGRLFVSDFYTRRVLAVDMEGREEVIARTHDQPSGLGWLPDGRLLIVSMNDRKVLRREDDGSLVEHVDLSEIASGACNDMAVDETGRAYVGNFGFDLMGGAPLRGASLAMVEPDGSVHEVARDLYFPNGCMITADGGTLLVNETFGNRVSAFEIGPGGRLGDRRDWAVFGPPPRGEELSEVVPELVVAPDGGALDDEGCLWLADCIGGRVLRVKEGGEVLDEISVGEGGAFACALGGPSGGTLFICVAPDSYPHMRKGAGQSSVLAVTL